MVVARLDTEAAQARNATRAQAQREAAEAAALQAKDLEAAQELETRAMERCKACACLLCGDERYRLAAM